MNREETSNHTLHELVHQLGCLKDDLRGIHAELSDINRTIELEFGINRPLNPSIEAIAAISDSDGAKLDGLIPINDVIRLLIERDVA